MRCKAAAAVAIVAIMPALSGCVGLFAAEAGAMAASGAIGDPTADLGHRSLTWAPTAATLRRAYARLSDRMTLRWSPGVRAVADGTATSPMAMAGADLPTWTIRYKPRAVIDTANAALMSGGKRGKGYCRTPVHVQVSLSGLQWDLVSHQVAPGHVRRWTPVASVDIDVVVRSGGKPLLHDHYASRASGGIHKERARLKAVPPVLDEALVRAYAKAMAGLTRALTGSKEAACVSG